MTPPAEFATALGHHQAGRIAQAEGLYRRILLDHPDHAPTLHLLGLIEWAHGRRRQAEQLIRRAIERAPDERVFRANLAKLLLQEARHPEAIALLREALVPDDAASRYDLGLALYGGGHLEEALVEFHEALRLRNDHAHACNAIGLVHLAQGHPDEAIGWFVRALRLFPALAEAHANLGNALRSRQRFEEALACYQKAVELHPRHAAMRAGLAESLDALRRMDEAAAQWRIVLELSPDMVEAHNNLGNALKALGRLDEAMACYRQALQRRPDLPEAHANLALVHHLRAEHESAVARLRDAVALKPGDARLHSNLLYVLHFHPQSTRRSLGEAHAHWNRLHALPLAGSIRPHDSPRDPARPLRVGYVSPDMRNHAVGRFLAPLLENHHRAAVEVFCYTDVRPYDEDHITARLRAAAGQWRSIRGLDDERVAELIRQDRIDILVDLTMHLEGSRLLVFARKPAPVQVTYLAHCSTTGLTAIDFRLTDPYLDPPDLESFYSEQSAYLTSYWCYGASPEAGPVSDLPCARDGTITFGCLNNFSKVSQAALEVWGRLLAAVPRSQLLLHAHPGSHQDQTRQVLAEMGVAPQRCQFVERLSVAEYFRLYDRIDIALDPFPYAGGTTTCDALWMGVPVITLGQKGALAVGRGGVSVLSQVGLEGFIAPDAGAYVEITRSLAADRPRLGSLRQSLRNDMRASPLMDAPRFVRGLEAAYRVMWEKWCTA